MEELGFAIAVPETTLLGSAVMIVLIVIILMKVLKTARQVEDIYYEVDDINGRLKRMEKLLEKLEEKKG